MDIDEKAEFVKDALLRMARYTHPFIAGIVGDDPDARMPPFVGSAFRMSAGRQCIVTAAHVAYEAREKFGRVGVTAERGAAPVLLTPEPDLVDGSRDLAVFFLRDDYPKREIDFWPLQRTDEDEDKLTTDFLVLHGFPAVQSRFSALGNALYNTSLPYGVMRRDEDLPRDLRDFQFAMDFDPANFQRPDGMPSDWLDPHGLSGSPVWRIGASGRRVNDWSPDLSQLVGVVTQWRPDERLLVGTKVRHLVALLGT